MVCCLCALDVLLMHEYEKSAAAKKLIVHQLLLHAITGILTPPPTSVLSVACECLR